MSKLRIKPRTKNIRIPTDNRMFDYFDIAVEPKFNPVVMIYANSKGRKVVEDLWPDVEWTRDDPQFAPSFPLDWQFTHVRITKLQSHLEAKVPLSRAVPESLSMAVVWAIAPFADKPVAHFWGDRRKPQMALQHGSPGISKRGAQPASCSSSTCRRAG